MTTPAPETALVLTICVVCFAFGYIASAGVPVVAVA